MQETRNLQRARTRGAGSWGGCLLVLLAACSQELPEPTAVEPPVDVVSAGLELRLETETISLGDGNSKRVYEGSLLLGEWEVFQLPERSPSEDRSFYLFRLPLTLHLLGEGRRFRVVHLRVGLRDPEVVVADLFPKRLREDIESVCFTVNEGLRFQETHEAGVTELFILDGLRTDLLGLGARQRAFDWIFQSSVNRGLPPGDYDLFFILSLPKDHLTTGLEVTGQATVAKEFLGWWIDKTTVPSTRHARLDLRHAVDIPDPPKSLAPPTACRTYDPTSTAHRAQGAS